MNLYSDVCIVGAGPGGALLGYLLAKNNISTVVLERNSRIDKEFRGEHINEVGEHLLKKHNLYNKIQEYGILPMERIEYWDQGKPFKTIYASSKEDHLGIHIPQNHLLSVLTNEAKQFPHYRLLMNTAVNDLIEDATGKYIGVKANRDGDNVNVYASIIIASDGRFSTVKKLAHIPYQTRKHGYDLLWAKIPAPVGWKATIRFAMVDGEQLALFTQAGGFVQIGWNIKEGSYPEIRKQSFEPYIQKLVEAFPQLEGPVRQQINSWNDFVFLSVFSSSCEQWTKDGLVVIGDAAHTMTPTGAFGINCSLKDADMLAEILINMEDIKSATSQDFQTFEESRKQEMTLIQEEQIKQEQTYKENFLI
ncbi:MAG: hypothetical protein K0S25_2036 [Bacillus sp. (in: firmicutes)]|nr:hypothetical protein [Bacillus sp. (in: firmicutes)]